MKKLALFTAVALMITMLFCACSGENANSSDNGPAENTKTLTQVFEDIKSQVELNDFNEYTKTSSLDRFYGITEDQIEEFAGGINSSGVNQEEIVLIKAVDKAAADSVKTALDRRYDSKVAQNKNYNQEQAAMVEKCKVEQNDLYVSLIVSENAEKITSIYKNDLGL